MQDKAKATEKSLGELIHDVTENVSELVRSEVALAKSEMRDSMAKMTAAGAMFGAAAVLAVIALAVLVTAGVLALSMVVQPWAAAVIVGFILLIGAATFAMIGKSKAKHVSVMPERTIQNVRADVDVVKRGLAAVKEIR
jgi:membrane protein